MALSLNGADELRANLQRVAAAALAAGRAELGRIAHDVEQGSIERAPYKEGDLERAHEVQAVTRPAGIRFVVKVDESVAPYAIYMHEGFVAKDGTPEMPYKLGVASMMKNAGTPHMGAGVGWKFLERSFTDATADAEIRLAGAISTAIGQSVGVTVRRR
ncbi:MAG TPA: hypothetical protein VKQ27_05485 [Acetobacteraceae bacterium]|nr:hypothetical protein [Acetobacteraceae bacterium]